MVKKTSILLAILFINGGCATSGYWAQQQQIHLAEQSALRNSQEACDSGDQNGCDAVQEIRANMIIYRQQVMSLNSQTPPASPSDLSDTLRGLSSNIQQANTIPSTHPNPERRQQTCETRPNYNAYTGETIYRTECQ